VRHRLDEPGGLSERVAENPLDGGDVDSLKQQLLFFLYIDNVGKVGGFGRLEPRMLVMIIRFNARNVVCSSNNNFVTRRKEIDAETGHSRQSPFRY